MLYTNARSITDTLPHRKANKLRSTINLNGISVNFTKTLGIKPFM